jgi:hypothetical protein
MAAARVHAEQAGARILDLDRFVGGERSLDELLEPTREEIRAVGGLTAEHLRSIGRRPDQQDGQNLSANDANHPAFYEMRRWRHVLAVDGHPERWSALSAGDQAPSAAATQARPRGATQRERRQ